MRLEVAPGTGLGTYAFKPKIFGDDVVYVDLEPVRVLMGDFVVASADSLPFRDDAFHEAYASHVVEHLEKPRLFIAELSRVIHGGKIHIWAPNFLSISATKDRRHVHLFNFINLTALVKSEFPMVHFPALVGGRVPNWLRIPLKALALLLSDELYVIGERT